VGNQTDPDRLTENPRCLESVGIEADRSASGYYKCGGLRG